MQAGIDKTIKGGGGADAPLGRIDKFELVRELGEGGFGAVYLARDTVAGIDVAIKGLPPEVKHNEGELEPIRANFALVSRLRHPNIVGLRDLHRAERVSYASKEVEEKLRVFERDTMVVMDYAPGVTLAKWRRQFPDAKVPLDKAIEIARQIASALDAAHAQKVLHRDVKPENVMVETREDGAFVARVLDFGLAAEIRSSMGRVSRKILDTSGTRPYMAPEQWLGEEQNAATDQYALAVLFYELVTGKTPFASVFDCGDTAVMRLAVTTDAPKMPSSLPKAMRKALAVALSKKPEERFASCGDFVAALEGRKAKVSRGGAEPRRKGGVGKMLGLLALLAVLAAFAGVGWLYHQNQERRRASDARDQKLSDQIERAAHEKPEGGRRRDCQFERIGLLMELRHNRTNTVARCRLGVIYRDFYDFKNEALREFELFVRLSSNSDPECAKVVRKVIPDLRAKIARSAEERLNANSRNPIKASALLAEGSALEAKHDAVSAMKKYEAALVEDPLADLAALAIARLKGRNARSEKEIHEALAMYRMAIDLNPGKQASYREAATFAYKHRRWNSTVAILDRALANFPASGEFLDMMIAALRKLGHIELAEAWWRFRLSIAAAGGGKNAQQSTDKILKNRENSLTQREENRKADEARLEADRRRSADEAQRKRLEEEKLTRERELARQNEEESRKVAEAEKNDGKMPPGKLKSLILPGGAEMRFRWCPPGSFSMGDGDDAHDVTLTRGFWMGETEVTEKQWRSVMSNNLRKYEDDDYPVQYRTWYDCQDFIKKINAALDCGVRLPTEAEWEYACLAGATGDYGGTGNLDEMGWYGGNSERKRHPVGQKKPNDWGLYDMHGNMLEWCSDLYSGYVARAVSDPRGPDVGGRGRVLRGGSFLSTHSCTAKSRNYGNPSQNMSGVTYVGFRLCFSECLTGRTSGTTATLKPSVAVPVFPHNPTNKQQVSVSLPGGATMEMIYVAPGSFMMGSPKSEEGRKDDETQHRVTLTKGFWLGKYEVTQKQWDSVMDYNPSKFRGFNLPADSVTWDECSNFIHKVNSMLHCGMRLPTETEWEYACRAGTTTAYYWGDHFDSGMANCYIGSFEWNAYKPKGPKPVGSYRENPWGFHDMHGNVSEWCFDWYDSRYEGTGGIVNFIRNNFTDYSENDPAGPQRSDSASPRRVLRGGDYASSANVARSAHRRYDYPTCDFDFYGFRLCCPDVLVSRDRVKP